jgi:hypothetical protein
MTNSDSKTFHGLTVAHSLPDGTIAFGQIKNSLSGTSLSGNWVLSQIEHDAISSVCRSHIVVSNKETLKLIEQVSNQSFYYGEFNALISSIQSAENALRIQWDEHLLENPKKAKTLVPPAWANWKNALTIEDPISSLVNSGRSAHPDSTPDDMKSLIALARMVRHVLDVWRDLEDSRFSRKFLNISKVEPRIWPPDWNLSERGSK